MAGLPEQSGLQAETEIAAPKLKDHIMHRAPTIAHFRVRMEARRVAAVDGKSNELLNWLQKKTKNSFGRTLNRS
jgi:hypothetical protein